MAEIVVKSCSNPGCDQPGTSSCSACKTTVYCSVICQTADWTHHKEECDGHLRKLGNSNLEKALAFSRQRSYAQALRYADLAATKLKQLKDRRLETVQDIDLALACKFDALQFLGRFKEAMECAKERYTLWAMNHMRNPGSIQAALRLIESCIHNKEYEDAEHYARHAMFMINDMADSFIPVDQQPRFLADVSHYLATAILALARNGGIPPAEKAGDEAIELARKALEIHTQLHGTESSRVAADMGILGEALDHFNNVDDDEIPHLMEQAITIYSRVEGSSSVNVAIAMVKLGTVYNKKATSACAANDLDRCMANLELALPHLRDASRIFRLINHVDNTNSTLRKVALVEEEIRKIEIARAAAAAVTTTSTSTTTITPAGATRG